MERISAVTAGLSRSEASASGPGAVLAIDDLHVEFRSKRGRAQAVRGVTLEVRSGETLGIVGESGSGKSVSALSVLGLLPPSAQVTSGSVVFEGRDLLALDEEEQGQIRGSRVSMVFQDPLTSLNPSMTIGRQISEVMEQHLDMSREEGLERAIELLGHVGIPDPASRASSYPHQLSGGQRQRAMIAMAVACQPALLIADEPTSALDVTIQAQVLDLLQRLQAETGMAIVLITHDMGVVAGLADRVVVMYAGRIVEVGPTEGLLSSPRHPYTDGLLRSVPRLDRPAEERMHQIDGGPPDVHADVVGCAFSPRCRWSIEQCTTTRPPLESADGESAVACWVLPFDAPAT